MRFIGINGNSQSISRCGTARIRNTETEPDRTAVFMVHYCSLTPGNTHSPKPCNMLKLCHHCGFLWCLEAEGWVAGMFYFLWVKWRQPLGCSAVRAICEPVNKSSMGEPKPWSWGLSSHWLLCKARADENRGEEHQPRAMCRAERCTAPGPHAFSHWASTDLLPAGSEARALPSPWAVFEFQGCWVKFSFLFPNIIYAQTSHLLMGFSQKLLTPSWVS